MSQFTNPIVYWFEFASDHSGKDVYDMMKAYGETETKNFPVMKKGYDASSRVVYVGKVKYQWVGRMFVHLGYYEVPGTAGLQLAQPNHHNRTAISVENLLKVQLY